MGIFDIFKRPEQIERSPAEMEAADRLLTDCQRLPGLQFHRCRLPRGHTGTCHFEVIAGVEPTVRLPDRETLVRRRQLVWIIADKLHSHPAAKEAWGRIGLAERLTLGSKILELVYRVNGSDGGIPERVVMP